MTDYVFTEATEYDLRSVIRYTRTQWGDQQVRRYIETLDRASAGLAAGDTSYRSMEEIAPDLRMVRCRYQYIFCLPRSDAPALVIAIFHESMDLMMRLTERL